MHSLVTILNHRAIAIGRRGNFEEAVALFEKNLEF